MIAASGADAPGTARRPALGVLGGMGPLSSAEFVRTIYEHSHSPSEQDTPTVFLYSDPSFPDRTEAFLAARDGELAVLLEAALERLVAVGADQLMVCCMTAHHLFPRLSKGLRARLLSMVDEAVAAVERAPGKHLLVCSSGTRAMRLFERHPGWARVADRIVLPDADAQAALHRDVIYRAKRNADPSELALVLVAAMEQHGVRSCLAGCSEVHLLAKRFPTLPGAAGYSCVDPFDLLARRVAAEAASASP